MLGLDGVLADSMPVLEELYLRFMELHGQADSHEEFQALAGLPILELVARLKKVHQLALEATALAADYYGLIDSAYQDAARPTPGSRELLSAARRQGVPVVVFTSSPEQVLPV